MRHLIFDFIVHRKELNTLPSYQYDNSLSLNVILFNGALKPFIEIESADIEYLTKTKIQREADDDNNFLEMGTKTEVKRERDDDAYSLLEAATKTFVKRETDDDRITF